MTVSTETVCMAISRPGKNQLERSDFPCHIIILFIRFFVFLCSTCKGAGQWECTAQDCDGMYKEDP